MNYVDRNGTIHKAGAGRYTVCRNLIRAHYQPTDQALSCPACIDGRRHPRPPLAVEAAVLVMLERLDARIVSTVYVVEVAPGATVSVPAAQIRAWCEGRLESRQRHKNRGLMYCSGPGNNNGAPTRAEKV